MARILIDMNEVLVGELMTLVRQGRYQDLDQIMEVAATNQLKLEHTSTGLIESQIGGQNTRKQASKKTRNDMSDIRPETREGVSYSQSTLLREPSGERELVTAPGVDDLLFPHYPKLEDIFTWGQYNRILPVKVGLRVLDNMLSEYSASLDGSDVADLEEYHQQAAATAREFGLHIKSIDDNKGHKRSMRLSNGLPIGQDEGKSKSRYINHFLAKRRKKDNILDGFEARLGLVNIMESESGGQCIGITEEGLKFSRISNPLLFGRESDWPLSQDEIDFYKNHVIEFVPEERATLHEVLILVNEGNSSAPAIDELMATAHKKDGWTGPMIVTNRAGALSRLWELRLITKSGIAESDIHITRDGETFLEHLDNS